MSKDPSAEAAGIAGKSLVGLGSEFDAGALRLLSCGALAVLLISLLLFVTGASEAGETRAWVVAFALALPGGLLLSAYQERLLSTAAPAAAARALAAGALLLAAGFLVRRTGSGDQLHHAVLAVAAFAALAAPILAARVWRDPADAENEISRAVSLAATAFLTLLFVPRRALEPDTLVPALALAAIGMLALRMRSRVRLPRPARTGLDLIICLLITLVVIQLPELLPYAGNLLIHHLFFLGPANDVVHGRAMLGTAWSQYGIGLIDLLGLSSKVIPLGFGTMTLIIATLTALAYVCVYAVLRLTGVGFLLSVAAIAVAAMGNLFATLEAYVVFPSTSPL
ncbi:MAG TPA: hypothetical protein VFS26_09800, partial [Solirubrobacterales bacterium]|nr:hypothetical protein [Solirubrobacterales bacterium]